MVDMVAVAFPSFPFLLSYLKKFGDVAREGETSGFSSIYQFANKVILDVCHLSLLQGRATRQSEKRRRFFVVDF